MSQPWDHRGDHAGPCLNWEGQHPDDYNPDVPCIRHIATGERWIAEVYRIVAALAAHDPGTPCVFCGQAAHARTCVWARARAVAG